jgi:hypothetical protein
VRADLVTLRRDDTFKVPDRSCTLKLLLKPWLARMCVLMPVAERYLCSLASCVLVWERRYQPIFGVQLWSCRGAIAACRRRLMMENLPLPRRTVVSLCFGIQGQRIMLSGTPCTVFLCRFLFRYAPECQNYRVVHQTQFYPGYVLPATVVDNAGSGLSPVLN